MKREEAELVLMRKLGYDVDDSESEESEVDSEVGCADNEWGRGGPPLPGASKPK